MGGGVLNGVILGLVVSGVVLAVLSLSTPVPDRPGAAHEAAAPRVSDAADADADPSVPPPATETTPVSDLPVSDATQPGETSPEAETSVVPPEPEDTTPAPRPAPRSAVTGAGADAVTLGAPAIPDPPPSLPRIDAQPSPAMPAAPADAPARDSSPGLPAPADAPSVAIVPDIPAPLAPAPSPRFSAVADGSAGGAPPRRLQPAQGLDTLEAIDTTPPPAPPPAPDGIDPSGPPVVEPAAPDEAGPDPDATPVPPRRLPQVAPAEDAPLPAVPGVAPRLPQAGVPMAPQADAGPQVDEAAAPDDMLDPAPPNALRDNAAPFDAPEGTPLLAIVLIDDPDSALDPAVLTGLPFLVSFAIDPMRPDAAARAAAVRDLGHEVVILGAGAIPPGAAPSDVEVALAVARATLPQAVALMDDPASRIQADRPVIDATVAVLAESGHGLIAFPRGLNAAAQSARRAEVPVATVHRLLDDEDQSAPVITRYLGRAAVAAVQEGAVVVVARTRPDTVTALVSWASSGRSEGVAIAPVSAALLRLSD